jgi:hypothetical protein
MLLGSISFEEKQVEQREQQNRHGCCSEKVGPLMVNKSYYSILQSFLSECNTSFSRSVGAATRQREQPEIMPADSADWCANSVRCDRRV